MRANYFLLLFIALYTFLFIPIAPVLAFDNSPDKASPIVQHDSQHVIVPAGKALKIDATIRNNLGIKNVTFFYRKSGESNYQMVKMNTEGNDLYSATIPEEAVQEPGLDYFIQASDEAGNIIIRGLAFTSFALTVVQGVIVPEPIKPLILIPSPEERMTMKTEAPAFEGSKPWYKKWWIWTIAGAVVIGAAAAGGHGGGGGESGGGAPSTGSAKITGPTP